MCSPQKGQGHTTWLMPRLILQSLSPGSLTGPRTQKFLWTKLPFLPLSALCQVAHHAAIREVAHPVAGVDRAHMAGGAVLANVALLGVVGNFALLVMV